MRFYGPINDDFLDMYTQAREASELEKLGEVQGRFNNK